MAFNRWSASHEAIYATTARLEDVASLRSDQGGLD
jgi:hypothetical protein